MPSIGRPRRPDVLVSVLGTGYVGLVSGAGLAEKGHRIICVDAEAARVDAVRRGVPPFYEPGLRELLVRNADRLEATTDLRRAVLETDLSLIAVGTPFANGQIDLDAVRTVARQIGQALRGKRGHPVGGVQETVVPGATGEVGVPPLGA